MLLIVILVLLIFGFGYGGVSGRPGVRLLRWGRHQPHPHHRPAPAVAQGNLIDRQPQAGARESPSDHGFGAGTSRSRVRKMSCWSLSLRQNAHLTFHAQAGRAPVNAATVQISIAATAR